MDKNQIFIADQMPIGIILDWPVLTIPDNYARCEGQAISRTLFSELFATIGTQFGAGDGATTFNLPDRRGKFALGKDLTNPTYDTVGKSGGSFSVTITQNEMPTHTHTQDPHTHTQDQHRHRLSNHSHSITIITTTASSKTLGLPGGSTEGYESKATSSTGPYTDYMTPTINDAIATNQDAGSGNPLTLTLPILVTQYLIKLYHSYKLYNG
jgi:microcystin-dependent protein